ncbi:MAG: DUF4826 family protein [Gammaproteobacteria bacterium]|nr:DUF4826 family protein [Gammaproteobacteria bacterium]NNK33947.1 DUF4826 family protein [Xanthomonadales bacterium]
MSQATPPVDKDTARWVKEQLDRTVQELIGQGRFDRILVEAKPAWALPQSILIGKIREQGPSSGFEWFISGDCPTDLTSAEKASSPREAARHFCLKWQLEAARQGSAGDDLAEIAEALYRLVEEDSIWLTS